MEARTRFSASELSIAPITENDYDSLSDFCCGVDEIDNFIHNELPLCSKYKYLIPYKCIIRETGVIAGVFTLSNDLLALEYEDKINFPNLPIEYDDIFSRQSSFPAVNIGHLAIRCAMQSHGLGQYIVEFVRMTFLSLRLSGCQFITVDALNNADTLRFYQDRVGFEFQTLYDLNKPTRRMYLDLIT